MILLVIFIPSNNHFKTRHMQTNHRFDTSILHASEGIPLAQKFIHYTKEWERLDRLPKLALYAKVDIEAIQNICSLRNKVAEIIRNLGTAA